jgi:hypothetical protein
MTNMSRRYGPIERTSARRYGAHMADDPTEISRSRTADVGGAQPTFERP